MSKNATLVALLAGSADRVNGRNMLDIFLYIGMFVLSLAALLKGSDWLIESAERIGLSAGISPFIIGITIVAFGTSLPELATSIVAVLEGQSEIVISTVVGSNITNIALVLGISALVVGRIQLANNVWHIDMPYLWGSAFILWFITQEGQVNLVKAILLLLGIGVFLGYSVRFDKSEELEAARPTWKTYFFLVLGGVFVWLGSDYTIEAIQYLSLRAGIDPEIIAVSAVALGTSLPEVIVSLNACRKGKADIAVGNVVGSNIFNSFVVMGIPSLIAPLHVPESINQFYMPLMIVMTILFGIMTNNRVISRWEGALLILFYLLFLLEIFKGALS